MMLCSLASDSRAPSPGPAALWLSLPSFSRLSAVREVESASWQGRGQRGKEQGSARGATPLEPPSSLQSPAAARGQR